MLYYVFQIEHHLYYVIYLRPTVDRVYFCKDIVVLQTYLNCVGKMK